MKKWYYKSEKEFFKWAILFIVWFSPMVELKAQSVYQVATQTFKESKNWNQGDTLKVIGEKSSIKIQSWNKNVIEVEIKFVSKHPEKAIALSELSYLHYNFESFEKLFVLNNYFQSNDKYQKVRGVLIVEYIIKVPIYCPIKLENQYGSIQIKNLDSDISIISKFTDVNLFDTKGYLKLLTTFGKVNLEKHDGDIQFETNRTDVVGAQLNSNISGTAFYGQILFDQDFRRNIVISAKRTAVNIVLADAIEAYNFELQSLFGEVLIPDKLGESHKSKFEKSGDYADTKISINTTHSNINIQSKVKEYVKN
ncbi:MAG: hypothetical protein ACI9A7_000757 [Cyclobacteriaceae bacterium]|jgi:hypothetical protein